MKVNGKPVVPEVCIFFENLLMRGNRTTKIDADDFHAFHSSNYPALARAGVTIRYETNLIYHPQLVKPLKPHYEMDKHVVVLKLFPGISEDVVRSVLHIPNLRGVVLETFGSGNAPTDEWFLKQLREAVERGIAIVNVTQCAR